VPEKNDSTMEMILIYPVFVGIAIATAELARQKGYRGRWWFLLGLIFPVFSILVLFLLKAKSAPAETSTLIPETNAVHHDKILYQKPV
jgi:hypothetical protein